jgi:NADH dehydrogenase/NADH:ubiquinone oxidoreductase subunit G
MSDSYSKPVSWDDALSVMAAKVASCAPNDFIMLISPDCTSEDLAAASQFCRDVIHTDQIFAPTHSDYSSLLDLPRSYRSSLSDLHNLSTNDLILGMGLDQRYFQSNISLEIKNAVLRGCPLILIQPGHTHLDRFASQVIPAQPEKYQQILKFIKTFSINNLNKTDPQYDNPEINHLVASIRQANRVVLVMGDLYLETQANQDVCEWIQAIYPNKDIKLLCVPHPANLVAAHTLGIDRYLQEIPLEAAPYKFAYLIGVQPPSEFRLADFLVYQNFVHPTTTHHCDLILPTPAFSEENGTFLSYDSSVRRVHTAIHPPSGPLPSWKILSLLARRMGNHDFVMNFDQNQENIDVNFLKSFGLFNNKQPSTVQRNSGLEKLASPVFRGFPVSTWVEGLQDLPPLTHYSEPSR